MNGWKVSWVAPRRGAWIETYLDPGKGQAAVLSHPAGVRGLKRLCPVDMPATLSRTPQGCVD